MVFKTFESIFQPDCRFADLCVVEEGMARRMTLKDHYNVLENIKLSGDAPSEVIVAFDRARNIGIYTFFDYNLFMVSEVQAFGAFELALKYRLNGHGRAARGTLRNLVDQARKTGVLPNIVSNHTGDIDPIEAMIALRNELSHGASDIHSPAMALEVLKSCAFWIDYIFSL